MICSSLGFFDLLLLAAAQVVGIPKEKVVDVEGRDLSPSGHPAYYEVFTASGAVLRIDPGDIVKELARMCSEQQAKPPPDFVTLCEWADSISVPALASALGIVLVVLVGLVLGLRRDTPAVMGARLAKIWSGILWLGVTLGRVRSVWTFVSRSSGGGGSGVGSGGVGTETNDRSEEVDKRKDERKKAEKREEIKVPMEDAADGEEKKEEEEDEEAFVTPTSSPPVPVGGQ